MNLELKLTADGSNTIYNADIDENYHSIYGALQESKHVFINSGLVYFLGLAPGKKSISILEVGFGTGLNFLLSADFCAENNVHLAYTGIEAYLLSLEMIEQTGYSQYVSPVLWQNFIEKYIKSSGTQVTIKPNCQLRIANCTLLNYWSEVPYDIVYFDAFAAASQPEMWAESAIGHIIKFLKPGGIFVTYAITGNLKRALKALGCKVEKLPGAAGKREMLRAVKI